jgi:hypothetical protein
MKKEFQWYKDRIGKKVFRTISICSCSYCIKAFEEGMTIHDEQFAKYLFGVQGEIQHNYEDFPTQKMNTK